MSEKQRFAVRESIQIWDERKSSLWATAVNADRAQLIAEALNAAYVRQTAPKPQESATSLFEECVGAYQAKASGPDDPYYVYVSNDLRSIAPSYVVMRLGSNERIRAAWFDNLSDAIKERDRLNAEAKAAPPPTAADPVDAAAKRTEPKPQESATSTYHVYGSHDLVNQTVCYKVRRKDAEGVEYLVAQFDNFLAAIKERDRLNAEAKSAPQPAADPVDAAAKRTEPKPQERVDTSQDYYVWTYANLRDGKPMHAVKHRAKDGDVMTVAVYERGDEAREECVRLNALRNDVRQQAEANQSTAADPVDAPDHYRQGEIECIDAVKAMLGAEGFAYWLRGNMVAYVWRMPHKGEPVKDAGKTRNLAERLERLLAE